MPSHDKVLVDSQAGEDVARLRDETQTDLNHFMGRSARHFLIQAPDGARLDSNETCKCF